MARIPVFLVAALFIAACGTGVPTQPPSANPTPPASLTPTPSPSPTAAPATGRIAFARQVSDEAVDLFIADPDGSNLVRLTNSDGGAPSNSPANGWAGSPWATEHGLIWSPDGTRLFYESETMEPCGDTYCFPTRLFSILPDGMDVRDLGPVGPGPDDWDTRGAVSPNGRFAAYGDPSGIGGPIVIIDLATVSGRQLSTTAVEAIWSPDGTRLLIYGLHWVAVLDATAGETIVRSDDPLVNGIVGWTPDSRSVIYQRCDLETKDAAIDCLEGPPWVALVDRTGLTPVQSTEQLPRGVSVISPDGSRWAMVTYDGLYVGAIGEPGVKIAAVSSLATSGPQLPTWSPDGRWIAFAGGEEQSLISVIAATGGRPTVLGPGFDPAWQPTSAD